MRFFTDKQFDKYTAEIMEYNYKEGMEDGYQQGFENGRRAGLMADKKGILMDSSGMYIFENGEAKNVGDAK